MSNSIWKTPDQKPEDGRLILFFAGGGRFPYLGFYCQRFDLFEDWDSKDVQRWASVLDLIAQADKAERLQKAVDYALQVLDNVSEIGGIDLEIIKIKQLIKGE